jgi:hypothetical protein
VYELYGAAKISKKFIKFKKKWCMTPSDEAFFAPQNAQIHSHKLTLEVLKVNIFRFKMQNDPIWAYNQMPWQKSHPHRSAEKSPLGNYSVCPNSGN